MRRLTSTTAPNHVIIPWMPTLVRTDRLFLGRHEQAEERSVVFGLSVTHILSIGRSPENRFEGIFYFGLDGERDLTETLEASCTIIRSVISQGGRIMVHGVEGLNRSAAVIIAHLMQSTPCLLEDAYFYVQVLRPFIKLDDACLECLLKFEKSLFGRRVTDVDELWI